MPGDDEQARVRAADVLLAISALTSVACDLAIVVWIWRHF